MKKIVKYITEIIFAIVLIFVSYFAWDRIDVNAYEKEISQYNIDKVAIDMENDFSELAYLSDENSVDDTVLYINNYQNKNFNTDIMLVLSGINDDVLNDFYLSINGIKYCLKDIYVTSKNNEYYFLIANVNLTQYEKTDYKLKILVDDNFDFNEFSSFSYRIQEEIKG